jgi:isoaspartyl peptidase/L-asparaginase-like protein (Ntn-hydrolase superfamily)
MVATWPFSLAGLEQAARQLQAGSSALEAAIAVARRVERDPEVDSVGLGGIPNLDGIVELDAAVMDGRDLSIGAVAALQNCISPVLVADRIRTSTAHQLLVGSGAEKLAAAMGLERTCLLTDKSLKTWQEQKAALAARQSIPVGHDTVGIAALDLNGDLAAVTSTSGIAMKLAGRVGDSPLAGSGFYADNDVGAAAATGLGEEIMKGCLCYEAVALMRSGLEPQTAAEQAIRQLHRRLARTRGSVGEMALVCVDRQGRIGAAANHASFQYAAAAPGQDPAVRPAPQVS